MKKSIIIFIVSLLPFFAAVRTSAQVSQENRFPQAVEPHGFCSYQYTGAYFNKKSIYTLRQVRVSEASGQILQMALNPTGATVAAVYEKGKGTSLSVYDFWKEHTVVSSPKLSYSISTICYSPDARSMAVCDRDGRIHLLDSKTLNENFSFDIGFVPERIRISPNLNFLLAGDGNHLEIRILKTGELRKSIEPGVAINDFLVSPDNSFISVLTSDGFIIEYDTASFLPGKEIGSLGAADSFGIHHDCKYYAVVTSPQVIAIVNRLNSQDRNYLDDIDNHVSSPVFINNEQGWLGYCTEKSIVYKQLSEMKPNYRKLVAEEIETRMKEWSKRMPGESLEDYNLRVNDESRAKQAALFEEEIATRLAAGQLECSQIFLGEYNLQDQILSLNFDTMPPIYLKVPQEQLGNFSDLSELEFKNARYGLREDDSFELVYVEVYNKRSGMSYTFDNRERKSLEYMKINENFVPLDIMQLANMEELRLEDIKTEIVNKALDDNKITNHTNISVTTGVERDIDAFGRKILNYRIGFTYDVQADFSVNDDYAPGKYKLEYSAAASSMASIIKSAFEGGFSQYLKGGKKVLIKITGMADNLKIRNGIPYDGCFGDFVNEPVWGKELYAITVTKASGITENDQLALIRAASIKDYIDKNISGFDIMDRQIEYHVVLSEASGGAFRRTTVEFLFYDAF